MANGVFHKSYGNRIHGRCARIKGVTNRHVKGLICRKCQWCNENVEDQEATLHGDVGAVIDLNI